MPKRAIFQVINKSDLIEAGALAALGEKIGPGHQFVSATTGDGIPELERRIADLARERTRVLVSNMETGLLLENP